MRQAKDILKEICDFGNLDLTYSEAKEALNELDTLVGKDDFYFEIQSEEYRLIHEDAIWDIYVEEIKQITLDRYNLDIPDFLVIDWEETAQNCYVDGYGHNFAPYDREETTADSYYIFRVN